ncbi:Rho GTPase activation protein [Gongronella butleri]|nr:Rho GTPase activation protein [Gongronella butleri]
MSLPLDPATEPKRKHWWQRGASNNKSAAPAPQLDDRAGLFGVPLTQSIEYAYSTISYYDEVSETGCLGAIPSIVARCGHFLKEQGLQVEGIFRMSGSAKRINQLQQLFESRDTQYGILVSWDGFTVHDAANVLKRYLNRLPVPVIPADYHERFLATLDHPSMTDDDKVQAFQGLVDNLPVPHQFLLMYLLDLLAVFNGASDVNRMDIPCLASIFAPGFMTQPDADIHINPVSYKEAQRVLEYLIEHQDHLHMPRPVTPFRPEEYPARPLESKPSPPSTLTTMSDIHPLYSSSSAGGGNGTQSMTQLSKPPSSSLYASTMTPSWSQTSLNQLRRRSADLDTAAAASPPSSPVRRSMSIPAASPPASSSSSPLAAIARARQKSLPATNANPAAPKRWKSIRTVPASERHDRSASAIATQ